jgi:3-phenylpropionate/trans-cinnamate dioxygenase ferredoxin reductase subunit
MTRSFVIAGAGLTGANAAAELREQGFDGRIVLVGAEEHLPYERPPLTKDLLRGESTLEAATVFDAAFYAEHAIELLLGRRADDIDCRGRELRIAGGESVAYDKLLIATGAHPIRLRVPGADLDGVVVLRTVGDALALRARAQDRGRIVIVGGGWIGMEAAASLRALGAEVTVVEAAGAPLERVLGRQLGDVFAGLHREHGVEVLTGAALERFDGDGAVSAAVLADGRRLECDTALVGVGVRPAMDLAERAGLATGNGIAVSAALQTSDPEVYGAGDVALAEHPRYGPLRVEHWENARRQGRAAARSMLGQDVTYDAIPYFFSDQYDLGLEYSGYAQPDDELVIRGDLEAREFVAFWLRDGRVTAGMNVNVWDVADGIRALIGAERAALPTDLAGIGA